MPWASPATETGAEFEPAFKGTLHVNEIGFVELGHAEVFEKSVLGDNLNDALRSQRVDVAKV